MEPPSSDGLEFLSGFELPKTRPPSAAAGSSTTLAAPRPASTGTSGGSRLPARGATLSNVIELSDGSEDEGPSTAAAARRGGDADSDDGEVLVVEAGPSKPTKRPRADHTSDDLPSASAIWGAMAARTGHAMPVMGRSASLGMAVGTSASASLASAPLARAKTLATYSEFDDLPSSAFSLPSGFSSSPALPAPAPPPPAADPKGKGKGKHRLVFDEVFDTPQRPNAAGTGEGDEEMEETQPAEEELWADILAGDTPAAKEKGKGKGKKKGEDGEAAAKAKKGKKRLFNEESGSEGEAEGGKKAAGMAKAPRLSPPAAASKAKKPPAASTSTSAAAAPALSKTALKKLETADRMRLREANTLRAGDKKVSTAELTVHISGTAFSSSFAAEDDTAAASSARTKGKGKSKDKPSPWVEISSALSERLRLYDCDVVCPEVVLDSARDLGSEGALRWTRVCDRMWSEERRMFLPLGDGEKIVVEEDSRLVFLTAHDLSHHVAARTLSAHISSLQSRLPPHVNLFVLLYGLNTLFRDLERARQEAYRNSLRDEGAAGAGARAVKPPGIGENQPGKDELELELMRVQVESRCMIVSVDKASEAVDWLEQLTFDVGQKPYQRLKHSHISLLGTVEDKIPSGKDLQDTYIKLLASLPRVTEPVAKGIVGEYPTLRALYEAWEACEGGERGRREMLVGIGKGRNIDGTATHRMIGTALSTSIYKILTGQDPSMFL
ncbi:hypothetical protein JCM6882_004653 [Rhodosporidiobolus microsporus]